MKSTTTSILCCFLAAAFFVAACDRPSQNADVVSIVLDADSPGREFEGWGALSAGATSVMLRDYPEPQRSDILDFLFLPNFGLSMHHLKVEIGSGIDSTSGAEPSHVIVPEELENPVPRGYEFWLAAEALKRNPDIMLEALPWGTPYWTTDFTTKEAADWVISFLEVAKEHYGLDFQYLGGVRNEISMMTPDKTPGTEAPFRWIKEHLRPALDSNGYEDIEIVAADFYNRHIEGYTWSVINDMMADPELWETIDIVGYHYPVGYLLDRIDDRPMPDGFLESGKRIWASEDYSVRGGEFSSAHNYMAKIIREYDELRMTKSIAWAPFTSMPEGFMWHDVGFIDASNSWNGHYSIFPGLWAMAQLTQFTAPGWQFMDTAILAGADDSAMSYAGLKAPHGEDWSLIVVTGDDATEIEIQVDARLAGDAVHVWKTDDDTQLEKVETLVAENGVVRTALNDTAIYTLTTTTGQSRGEPANEVPPEVPGGPWSDSFESYEVHDKPLYWGDLEGTFEIVKHDGKNVLQQVVPTPGAEWHKGLHGKTILLYGGADNMRAYSIDIESTIQDGFVELGGIIITETKDTHPACRLNKSGEWSFVFDSEEQTGSIDGFNGDDWHSFEFNVEQGTDDGYVATCAVDGTEILRAPLVGTYEKRVPYIGSSYDKNMFRFVQVVPGE